MAVTGSYDVTSVADLRAVVGEPLPRTITQGDAVARRARDGVHRHRTVSRAGNGIADGSSDASPKGGPPGFVRVLDETRLLVPEFPGNRRLDGVQNLVERPGVGLLFIVPGITETLRVNGIGRLTRDPELCALCAIDGKPPWFVIDVEVRQVFSHCSKAFLRSGSLEP